LTDEFIINLCLFGLTIVIFLWADLYIKRKADEEKENFFRRLYAATNKPVKFLFAISVIYSFIQHLGLDIEEDTWSYRVFIILLISGMTWLTVKFVGFLSDRILRKFDTTVADNLQARAVHTQIKVVRRLIIAIVVIIGIAAVLMTFEQIKSLGVSLLASAGVAGIVLGLAAQKTIGNFFTGIQIAITQPIRLDDSVVVEGEWGWIEEINLTYVVIKLWDLRRLVLPISYFVEQPFQNWTRRTAEIIGSVFLYVDYRMPIDALREELDRILEDNELWNKNVKVVQVTECKESTVQIRVLVSARNAPTAWDLRCNVRERLIDFMQKNYPQYLPRMRAEIVQADEEAA
jgi:small-conductance mechanosensitive channel